MCVLLAQAALHCHVIVDAASRHVDSKAGMGRGGTENISDTCVGWLFTFDIPIICWCVE